MSKYPISMPQNVSRAFRLWGTIASSTHQKKSRYEYRAQVQGWCNFLGYEIGTDEAAEAMLSATALHARGYRELIERRPGANSRCGDKARSAKASPATIKKKLAVLRSIYRDLQEEGLIAHNPFLSRLMPSVTYQKRPTEMLPFSKVWDVITAPGSAKHLLKHNYPKNCARFIRDRAILAILFAGGLRRSELVVIQVDGVKMTDRGVTYLKLKDTKNHGDKDQVIANWASEFVWAWHAARIEEGASGNDFLICPLWRHGPKHLPGGVSDSAIWLWFKEYLTIAGVDASKFSPHSARATAITRLLDQGVGHYEVKEFSRHSSIAMVERYDKRRTELDDNAGSVLEFPRKAS